jgi:hypothetical protein
MASNPRAPGRRRVARTTRSRVVSAVDAELSKGLSAEIVIVWGLFAVVTCEILATYSRLPASELYHVSGSGLEGGLSRALVFMNFPTALVALAVLVLLFERLDAGRRAVAAVAALLCAAVFWPGVVRQSNLDARPVNALAAGGVLLTLLLGADVARREGVLRTPWARGDWVRLAIAVPLLVLALPWLAAELGFFLNGVPLLGRVFETGRLVTTTPELGPLPAVHHGHHHGMDGVLLVLSALLLSRAVTRLVTPALRVVLTFYLALMFCYGVGNIANDAWNEQIVKRGWTSWLIPGVLEPRITVAWGVIVLATAAISFLAWRARAGRYRQA